MRDVRGRVDPRRGDACGQCDGTATVVALAYPSSPDSLPPRVRMLLMDVAAGTSGQFIQQEAHRLLIRYPAEGAVLAEGEQS